MSFLKNVSDTQVAARCPLRYHSPSFPPRTEIHVSARLSPHN